MAVIVPMVVVVVVVVTMMAIVTIRTVGMAMVRTTMRRCDDAATQAKRGGEQGSGDQGRTRRVSHGVLLVGWDNAAITVGA